MIKDICGSKWIEKEHINQMVSFLKEVEDEKSHKVLESIFCICWY
jgi:hypothetical protein